MSKIAIVGVEGSGKTVLMTVLGEKYQTPDQYGLFLSPETRETSDFHRVNLGKLENGEWPIETPHDSVRSLRWTLQRKYVNGENTVMADLNFLDFAGEIYREAFDSAAGGTGGQWVDECETLRRHVKESDVLIVLVNLRNVVLKMTDERTNQVVWLSKGIVDYAKRELKIPHVALAFTQVDAYREVIEDQGGDLKAVLQKYLPDVSNVYSNLPLFALSAVDKTKRGDDGLLRPAPGFGSKGLEELVHWILGCTEEGKKYAGKIAAIKNRPHDLWREIVAGMNALRTDAAQATGLSAAERFAKVSALQSAAVELAANDLRHTLPDFTEERLVELMTELESWERFAKLANEYVKAVEAKRNDIAVQIESNLVYEAAPSSLLLVRVREEVRQIRAAWLRRVVKWLIAAVLLVVMAVAAGLGIKSHNEKVDRLVTEKGYSYSSCLGVKTAIWLSGKWHPKSAYLKTSEKEGEWKSIRPGYEWIRGTASDKWTPGQIHPSDKSLKAQGKEGQWESAGPGWWWRETGGKVWVSGIKHPSNEKLISSKVQDQWRTTEEGYVWTGGANCEWRSGIKLSGYPHWVTSEKEGYARPEPGYRKKDPSMTGWCELVWNPGEIDGDRKASREEGRWLGKRTCSKCKGSGSVAVKISCDECGGSGRKSESCKGCDGKGKRYGACDGAAHTTMCQACFGTGQVVAFGFRARCPSCGGCGHMPCYICRNTGSAYIECSRCDGRGYEKCPYCKYGRREGKKDCPAEGCQDGKVWEDE